MKKQSYNAYTSLSSGEMAILTTEVKETIGSAIVNSNHRIFTSADLWNIQRQVRMGIQRRYL